MSSQQDTSSDRVNGHIQHINFPDRQDYLFRVSLKAVVLNDKGEILVVKETGRDWWDIPGGGMDHGESIKDALARELYEEVLFEGEFEYETLFIEDPTYLSSLNLYQTRLIMLVKPKVFTVSSGVDSDEVRFASLDRFKDSNIMTEQSIYSYGELAKLCISK